MRVFLTGGTGFIGGEVARLLRARGDEVRALVRNPAKAGALEVITFWATGKKAMDELGWTSRPLSDGLRDLVAAT
jgi:uncharacterized protein YbjT (DUF2867 family)